MGSKTDTGGTKNTRSGEGETLAADCPVIDSAQLFGSHKQLVIGHNGARYVLKITRYGKLILNK